MIVTPVCFKIDARKAPAYRATTVRPRTRRERNGKVKVYTKQERLSYIAKTGGLK